ncbi:MAG TPA: DNA topoisomerase IB, partial [Candidatus Kapabacteria bacterium]|nr:DNA topoisomerase IB [Candidatus Kapabacteria bacterium]
ISARDVNEYIKRSTAPAFSAKDFRTWGATVKAAAKLARIGFSRGEKTIKNNIKRAIAYVAEHLGNTVAVSRGSYIHPRVIKKYEQGVTIDKFEKEAGKIAKDAGSELAKDEAAVVALLKS